MLIGDYITISILSRWWNKALTPINYIKIIHIGLFPRQKSCTVIKEIRSCFGTNSCQSKRFLLSEHTKNHDSLRFHNINNLQFAINPIDYSTYVYRSFSAKLLKFVCANSKIVFFISHKITLLLIGKYAYKVKPNFIPHL